MKLMKINGKYVRTDDGLILAPQSEHDGTPISVMSEEELNAFDHAENIGKVASYNGGLYVVTGD